jgi:hypothetical protein
MLKQDLFMRMTLDSIGKVGFGVKLETLPSKWQLPLPENAFANAFDTANNIVSKRFVDPTWKLKRFLNMGHEAPLYESINVMNTFTYDVIAQRRKDLDSIIYQPPAVVAQEVWNCPSQHNLIFSSLRCVHYRSKQYL